MSLHLLFLSANDMTQIGYMPSVAWSDNPHYTHVELIVDGRGLCSFTGQTFNGNIITTSESQFTYQRVRLPDELKHDILRKFKALQFNVPYRYRDYVRASNWGHCPRSIVKSGFTCATMVAYLLGFEEYYSMNPDAIYNSLK